MVQNMDRVLTAFPASIDTVRAAGITKTILLTTDSTSRIINSPTMIQLNSGQQEGELASFKYKHIPLNSHLNIQKLIFALLLTT